MATTQHSLPIAQVIGPYRLTLEWRIEIDDNLAYTGAWVVEKDGLLIYMGGDLREAMQFYDERNTYPGAVKLLGGKGRK